MPQDRPARPKPPITIEMVADAAGVSPSTVSRVMNGVAGKTSAETHARVLQTVEELGYRPSRAGSTLRQGRSHLVGLLAPDPGNAYNASVAASVEQALQGMDRVMVLANTREDPAVQDNLLQEMRSLLVGGIVMLGAVPSPRLEDAMRDGVPVVFLNRRSPVRQKGPYIGIDNAEAGRAVGAHFAQRGYRRVAIFHGPMTSSATRGRVDGFQASFAACSGGKGQVRRYLATVDRKRSGYLLAARVLDDERAPDAIFCTTDEIAYGTAKQCQERGLRVPQDIALFGFDGNPLNDYLAPWLSTVHVPYEEFGPAAARLLRAWWDNGAAPAEDIILPFRLIIAPSC